MTLFRSEGPAMRNRRTARAPGRGLKPRGARAAGGLNPVGVDLAQQVSEAAIEFVLGENGTGLDRCGTSSAHMEDDGCRDPNSMTNPSKSQPIVAFGAAVIWMWLLLGSRRWSRR